MSLYGYDYGATYGYGSGAARRCGCAPGRCSCGLGAGYGSVYGGGYGCGAPAACAIPATPICPPKDCVIPACDGSQKVAHHTYTLHVQPMTKKWVEKQTVWTTIPETREIKQVMHPNVEWCSSSCAPAACAPAAYRGC